MHEHVGQVQFGVWKTYECLFIPNCTRKIIWLHVNNIYAKIFRWLSRRNAQVSRNHGKIAPWIAPSRECSWFENNRFDWPSVNFSSPTFLSINLISTFCTQFQLSALFGIDMLSANQHGESFASILLQCKKKKKIKMDDIYASVNSSSVSFG